MFLQIFPVLDLLSTKMAAYLNIQKIPIISSVSIFFFPVAFAVLLVNLVKNLSFGILFAFSVTVHQFYFTLYSDTGLIHCFMSNSILYKQNLIKHIL